MAVMITTGPTPVRADPLAPQLILFVGNSFVRGLRRPLRDLYDASGASVRVKTLGPSGWTLERHATAASTGAVIGSRPWNYVFLQEQSDGIDASGYGPARAIDAAVAGQGARTVFFMTWRDRGVTVAGYDSLRGEPGGNVGYVPIAFELDAPVAPVGWAIRDGLLEGLPYDLWQDGHHLNGLGDYLAACVCFATLTGISPVGLPAPKRIFPEEALYLQQLAQDTVLSDPAQWNLAP